MPLLIGGFAPLLQSSPCAIGFLRLGVGPPKYIHIEQGKKADVWAPLCQKPSFSVLGLRVWAKGQTWVSTAIPSFFAGAQKMVVVLWAPQDWGGSGTLKHTSKELSKV